MNEIIKYVIFTHMLDLCLQTLATQNNIYAYKSSQGYIEKTTERERYYFHLSVNAGFGFF